MLLKLVRKSLGLALVGFDLLTRPKPQVRSAEEQSRLQDGLSGHSLYQLNACPFCIKTRRALHKLNLDIAFRDVGRDPHYRQELVSGGGKMKVPCLRIEQQGETRWMYESNDIIRYFENYVAIN